MKQSENPEYSIHIENLYLLVQFAANTVPIPDEFRQEESPWDLLNLHTHPYTELFFCESGSLEIKTKNGIISLLSDDILLVPANVEHVRIPPKKNVRAGALRFSCFKRKTRGAQDFFDVFNRHLTKQEPLVIHQRHDLSSRLRQIFHEREANRDPFLISTGMADVLMQIMVSLDGGMPTQPKDSLINNTEMDIDVISRLEHLIAHHYMKDLPTAEAAKHFHISARQLDRIANRRYGTTFRRAVIQQRLRMAVEMFSATSMTIEEIGLAVGFSSRLSFARAFSAQHGMSPQQYRKRFC